MQDKYKPSRFSDAALLLLLWCAAVALANPVGDFPLNDDWAYGHNVRALAVDNRLYFSDWPAMTLFAHTLWGAFFSKVFGFSFTVLRFSTLLTGLAGLMAFYRMLQWVALPRRMIVGLMLLLVFNPLWFVLANSYMTDVPFVAILMWSVLYFLKILEKPTLTLLLAATFFALWACFIRQLGLIAPGVFLILYVYYQPLNWRNILFALSPLSICYAAMAGFQGWLEQTGQLPEAYRGLGHLWRSIAANTALFSIATERMGLVLMTFGLFLLPLAVSAAPPLRKHPPLKRGAQILFFPVALFCIVSGWNSFPGGNVFFNLGLGPKLLNDAIWGIHADPQLSDASLLGLKCVSGAAGLWLFLSVWSAGITGRQRQVYQFCICICLVYLGFICFNHLLIDRYFVVIVPFLLIPLGLVCRRFSIPGFILTALIAIFSITATHDYLAWNRARWQLAHQLMEDGAAPEKMDGGFEFNGWYLTGVPSQRVQGLKSWWFVHDNEWVIAFGPIWGYDVTQAAPFRRWLPPGPDTIYVNRRKNYSVLDSVWCSMEQLAPGEANYAPEPGTLFPGNAPTRSEEKPRSGRFSMKLTPEAPFGATIPFDTLRAYDRLTISVWRYPAIADAGIVVAAEDPSNGYFFEPSHLVERDSAGWGLLEMSITLPASTMGGEVKFYLWNPSSQQTTWFDDLKLYRLRVR